MPPPLPNLRTRWFAEHKGRPSATQFHLADLKHFHGLQFLDLKRTAPTNADSEKLEDYTSHVRREAVGSLKVLQAPVAILAPAMIPRLLWRSRGGQEGSQTWQADSLQVFTIALCSPKLDLIVELRKATSCLEAGIA